MHGFPDRQCQTDMVVSAEWGNEVDENESGQKDREDKLQGAKKDKGSEAIAELIPRTEGEHLSLQMRLMFFYHLLLHVGHCLKIVLM